LYDLTVDSLLIFLVQTLVTFSGAKGDTYEWNVQLQFYDIPFVRCIAVTQ